MSKFRSALKSTGAVLGTAITALAEASEAANQVQGPRFTHVVSWGKLHVPSCRDASSTFAKAVTAGEVTAILAEGRVGRCRCLIHAA